MKKITIGELHTITGNEHYADRKRAILDRLYGIGARHGMIRPEVAVQILAQVLHESGAFRHVREVWGPTAAQLGYEGRKDLGNVQKGDGKRYLGRDLIQCTGRANYAALTKWANCGADFEADPARLEAPRFIGLAVIWYFATRSNLLKYCLAGDIEMVTRRVNGGLNGYDDRLRWYDRTALVVLGFAPDNIEGFQKSAGLPADGISGPKTRAALHEALKTVGEPKSGLADIIAKIIAAIFGKEKP